MNFDTPSGQVIGGTPEHAITAESGRIHCVVQVLHDKGLSTPFMGVFVISTTHMANPRRLHEFCLN